MKKYFLLLIIISTLLAFLPARAADAAIASGLVIINPASETVIYPNRGLNLTVRIAPRATLVAEAIRVQIIAEDNTCVVQIKIKKPKIINDAVIRVPADAPEGTAVIRAVIDAPDGSLISYEVTKPVFIKKFLAALRINNLLYQTTCYLRQNFPVEFSLNKDSLACVKKITAQVLTKNGALVCENSSDKPQVQNTITLQMPAKAALGPGLIRVFADDGAGSLSNNEAFVPVTIRYPNTALKITFPMNKVSVRPTNTVNMEITMGPESIGIADKIKIQLLNAKNQVLAETSIDNPQAKNTASFVVPETARYGHAIIRATASDPDNILAGNTADLYIFIKKKW